MAEASVFTSLVNRIDWQFVSAIIAAIVTAVLAGVRWLLVKRLPSRRMWRFTPGREILIVVSSAGPVNTGVYQRPTTGIGQVRGMLILGPLLLNAFHGLDLERVRLSDETMGRELENNLLVLGGPEHNRVTKMLLDQLAPQLPFTAANNIITWDGDTYEGDAVNGTIANDYGYVVRAANPFNSKSRIVIMAGSHTYGTVAAARWLTNEGSSRKLPIDLAILVEADVIFEGHVATPRPIHLSSLRR